AGTLMCLNAKGNAEKCSETATTILGIVSDNPSAIGAGGHDGDSTYVLIGLVGQLNVAAATANGSIAVGDPLTLSGTPGVAAKATGKGQIVGRAMSSYTNSDPTAIGTVMVYVNISWFDPGIQITDSGNISFNGQALSTDTLALNA